MKPTSRNKKRISRSTQETKWGNKLQQQEHTRTRGSKTSNKKGCARIKEIHDKVLDVPSLKSWKRLQRFTFTTVIIVLAVAKVYEWQLSNFALVICLLGIKLEKKEKNNKITKYWRICEWSYCSLSILWRHQWRHQQGLYVMARSRLGILADKPRSKSTV